MTAVVPAWAGEVVAGIGYPLIFATVNGAPRTAPRHGGGPDRGMDS